MSQYLLIPAMHFPACSYYQSLLSSSLLPSVVLSLYPSPLSFKVFFVIDLYITVCCSLCCPPSVSSLLCLLRSPPVSSSLYTALCRFTQILMISFSFLLRLRVSPSRTEPGIKPFPKTYSIKWHKPWHKAPA